MQPVNMQSCMYNIPVNMQGFIYDIPANMQSLICDMPVNMQGAVGSPSPKKMSMAKALIQVCHQLFSNICTYIVI